MFRMILRIVINAVALWVAYLILRPNLAIPDTLLGLLFVAIVFGLVNAFIKPIVQFLSCPLTIITLGLFTLVINALMLMFTGWLTGGRVDTNGFWYAFLGAIIISIVSTVLNWFLPDNNR